MKLQNISAKNARGRDLEVEVQGLTLLRGPNGSGKTTTLQLIEAALNPPTSGRGIPVFGSATGAEWWVGLTFDELVIERRARKRGEARIDGKEWGPFKELDPEIHLVVGPAAVFDLQALLATSGPKRRSALMQIAIDSGAGAERTAHDYLRQHDRLLPIRLERAGFGLKQPVGKAQEDHPRACDALAELPPLEALALLTDWLARDLKEAKGEVQRIEKAIKSDEQKLDELGDGRSVADVQADLNAAIEEQATLREQGAESRGVQARLTQARELLKAKREARDSYDQRAAAYVANSRALKTAKASVVEATAKLEEAKVHEAKVNEAYAQAVAVLDHARLEVGTLERNRPTRSAAAEVLEELIGMVERRTTVELQRKGLAFGLTDDEQRAITAARAIIESEPSKEQVDEARQKLEQAQKASEAASQRTSEAAQARDAAQARRASAARAYDEAVARERAATSLVGQSKLAPLSPTIHEEIDSLRLQVAELAGAGEGVDEEALEAATARRSKLEQELVVVQDVAAQRATLAERRDERRTLIERRTLLHELHKAADTAQGLALDDVLALVLDPVQRIVYATTGDDVVLEKGSDLKLVRTRGAMASIAIEDASDAERNIVLAAFRVALAGLMPGWRHVAIDRLESLCSLETDWRSSFVAALQAEVEAGTVDNVLLACVKDGWTPPEGVHVVELAR